MTDNVIVLLQDRSIMEICLRTVPFCSCWEGDHRRIQFLARLEFHPSIGPFL